MVRRKSDKSWRSLLDLREGGKHRSRNVGSKEEEVLRGVITILYV